MGIEFELKYRATPQLQERLLQLAQHWQTISMETTYYDTPTLALAKKRYTLRRRLENGVSVCTVKTPAHLHGRGEWEVIADTVESAVPELCKLGAPEDLMRLTREGVFPVCGARFTRKVATITVEGSVLELALDTGCLFAGSKEQPLCEVEVELKQGNEAQALAYGQHLSELYGLTPEPQSKFRRALALQEEHDG